MEPDLASSPRVVANSCHSLRYTPPTVLAIELSHTACKMNIDEYIDLTVVEMFCFLPAFNFQRGKYERSAISNQLRGPV